MQYPTIVTYGPIRGSKAPVQFSLPADLSLVNPAWKDCIPEEYGVFDPPRTLQSVSALVSQDPGGDPSPAATPASVNLPAQISATATSNLKDPGGNVQQSGEPAPASVALTPQSGPTQRPDSPALSRPDSKSNAQTPYQPEPAQPSANVMSDDKPSSKPMDTVLDGEDKEQGSPRTVDPAAPGSIGGDNSPGTIVDNQNANTDKGPKNDVNQSPPDPGIPSVSAGDGKDYAPPDATGVIIQPTASPVDPVLIASQSIIRGPNGGVYIGSAAIRPGSPLAFAGHVIVASSTNILIDGSSYDLPTGAGPFLKPTAPSKDPILVANQPIVRASSGILIIGSSATVAPGAQTVIEGYTISAGISSMIIDGSTYTLPTTVGAVLQRPSTLQSITIANGAIISADGDPATVSGIIYSVPGAGGYLVADGKTLPLPTTPQYIFTIAGETFTAAPTGFVMHSQAIAIGGSPVTIGGTLISLGPSGLQIGSSTIPLEGTEGTTSAGLAGVIMSGFSNGPIVTSGTSNGSSLVPFTGASKRLVSDIWMAVFSVLGVGIGIAAFAL